jgi:hypothetical protein
MQVGVQSWLFRPPTESNGNIAVSSSLKIPTGICDGKGSAVRNGETITAVADQSLQPGDCRWGFTLATQAYRQNLVWHHALFPGVRSMSKPLRRPPFSSMTFSANRTRWPTTAGKSSSSTSGPPGVCPAVKKCPGFPSSLPITPTRAFLAVSIDDAQSPHHGRSLRKRHLLPS